MRYNLNIFDRPFQAIKAGTKKVEVRTPKAENPDFYDTMSPCDILEFINTESGEKMTCEILAIRKYDDVRSLLETEGTRNTLSSGGDLEGGIKSIHSLDGYEERIKKYGVYAIELRLLAKV